MHGLVVLAMLREKGRQQPERSKDSLTRCCEHDHRISISLSGTMLEVWHVCGVWDTYIRKKS